MHTKALAFIFIAGLSALTGCSNNSSSIPTELLAATEDPGNSEKGLAPWQLAAADLGIEAIEPPAGEANPMPLSIHTQQQSDANLLVLLQGQTTGTPTRIRWTQTDGPSVAFSSPNAMSTYIQLPAVAEPEMLRFRLSVANAQNYTNSVTTQVILQPLETFAHAVGNGISNDGSALNVTVRLSQPATQNLTVSYNTADGTAIAGTDYQASTGTIEFAPNEQERTISIPVFTNDALSGDVYFTVNLSTQAEETTSNSIVVIAKETPIPQPGLTPNISTTAQGELAGIQGVLRYYLTWDNSTSDITMAITDPCNNTLSRTNTSSTCQENSGEFIHTNATASENAVWQTSAASGEYPITISHLTGTTTRFTLYTFIDGIAQTYAAQIAPGQSIPLLLNVTGVVENPIPAPASTVQITTGESLSVALLPNATEAYNYELLTGPAQLSLNPVTGVLEGDTSSIPNLPLTQSNPHCLIAQADLTVKSGAADVLIAIDESGSMDTEHAWLKPMIESLEQGLINRGVGLGLEQDNLYGMVGFYNSDIPHVFYADDEGTNKITADVISTFTDQLVLTGGTEDGYHAIDVIFKEFELRENAGKNIILITDEDRDITDETVTYDTVLQQLNSNNATLNVVVDATITCADGSSAIGVDALGNGYLADGLGGYTLCANATVTSSTSTSAIDTLEHYVDLAFANGGAAWDLNRLRAGGLEAQSFSAAFVDIKVTEIIQSIPPKESSDLVISHAQIHGNTVTFTVKNRGIADIEDQILLTLNHTINGELDQALATADITDLKQGEEKTIFVEVDASKVTHTVAITAQTNTKECLITNNSSAFPLLRVKINDDAGRAEVFNLLLNLTETPAAPTISSANTSTLIFGEAFSFNITVDDANTGDSFIYELINAPDWLEINLLTGELKAKSLINSYEASSETFTIRVTDSTGLVAEQEHTLQFPVDVDTSEET